MTPTTTAHATPAAFRAHLDGLVRRVARVALEQCEAHARAVWGATVGVDRRRVDEWLLPDGQKRLSVADAMAAPEPVRLALARVLVGEGFVVAARPSATASGVDMRHVGASLASHTQAIRSIIDAAEDGRITPGEARVGEQNIDRAVEDLVSLREGLRAAAEVPAPAIPMKRRPA